MTKYIIYKSLFGIIRLCKYGPYKMNYKQCQKYIRELRRLHGNKRRYKFRYKQL